ncbi:hypothetical protein [Streptomyces fulvorobeus]|uniref:Uncharacterized protein n=1 Tax=Streptomyces fulvorobeus TaxID=284028 RepID=A0A7J0BZS3_9ACTN|nr:hypothetical protein [Streptomyces fulvorobeus]NYE39053.1 hypothetical protein [Streptomyces fulvorobeus]GFM95247.1 hypothetical protein Sfulv_00580 [Streptomyces fulvorobeus]
MRIDLDFNPGQHEMTIDLFDQEDIGGDDNLGGVVIGDNSSPLNELQHETIANFGAVYVLTYALGEKSDF